MPPPDGAELVLDVEVPTVGAHHPDRTMSVIDKRTAHMVKQEGLHGLWCLLRTQSGTAMPRQRDAIHELPSASRPPRQVCSLTPGSMGGSAPPCTSQPPHFAERRLP
jgi:hypothetical protein